MKTTIDLPEVLVHRAKAAAARQGQSMKVFVRAAVEERCLRNRPEAKQSGWRAVFGKAPAAGVASIDSIIEREFSQVDPESWK
jgi:hypothetical protein